MTTTERTAPIVVIRTTEMVTLGETTAPRYMTLRQFDDFPWSDDVQAELVRGEVYLSPMPGLAHGRIVRNIFIALYQYVLARNVGEVFGDGLGYVLPELYRTNRSPDVSFIRAGTLPAAAPVKGSARAVPDLAVEVLSPSDMARKLETKVADYFAAGTAVVWIVDPRSRRVTVRTPDGASRVLGEGETLDGAPVLPEFTLPVIDVFAGVQAPVRRAPSGTRRGGKSG